MTLSDNVTGSYLQKAIIKDWLFEILDLLLGHMVLMHAPQVAATHVGLQVDHHNGTHRLGDDKILPVLILVAPHLCTDTTPL